MKEEKSIYACYEEIKRREVRELEEAVRGAGGEYVFKRRPIVMCNFNGFEPHPADAVITRVELRDEEDEDVLYIFGYEKEMEDDEREINLSDIAYGHIDFITSEIPKRTISDETSRLCETVSELSNLLYMKLYDKYEDSFAVDHEIIHLALKFEGQYDRHTDFLTEIDKFADECVKSIDKD